MESYVERPPIPELSGLVRTVWIQRTGEAAYVQRHLPTGGVELHVPVGGTPSEVDRLAEAAARAATPDRALRVVQSRLLAQYRRSRVDPLVGAAVRALMPWQPVNIDSLAGHLALSPSQLRRRCLQAVGMSPKVLQRTLRFQGFLALAQAGATASGRRGSDGTAGLAIDAGYADQAHLSRECLRLTGRTPRQLLGGEVDRCACGHDHAASYRPFLSGRNRSPAGSGLRDLFKLTEAHRP